MRWLRAALIRWCDHRGHFRRGLLLLAPGQVVETKSGRTYIRSVTAKETDA